VTRTLKTTEIIKSDILPIITCVNVVPNNISYFDTDYDGQG